jgi:hypothetical protein
MKSQMLETAGMKSQILEIFVEHGEGLGEGIGQATHAFSAVRPLVHPCFPPAASRRIGRAGRLVRASGGQVRQGRHLPDFAARAHLVRGRISSGRTSSISILPVFETAKPAVKRN